MWEQIVLYHYIIKLSNNFLFYSLQKQKMMVQIKTHSLHT